MMKKFLNKDTGEVEEISEQEYNKRVAEIAATHKSNFKKKIQERRKKNERDETRTCNG